MLIFVIYFFTKKRFVNYLQLFTFNNLYSFVTKKKEEE